MHLAPFDLPGLAACSLPADAARDAGCDTLTPLDFPDGADSTVLEGTVPPGRRACWIVRLRAGRRLDLRLTNAGRGAAVEVRSLSPAPSAEQARGSVGSFASSSVSSSSISSFAVGGETRVSVGPQRADGEFFIVLGATRGAAAPYRLEVTLR